MAGKFCFVRPVLPKGRKLATRSGHFRIVVPYYSPAAEEKYTCRITFDTRLPMHYLAFLVFVHSIVSRAVVRSIAAQPPRPPCDTRRGQNLLFWHISCYSLLAGSDRYTSSIKVARRGEKRTRFNSPAVISPRRPIHQSQPVCKNHCISWQFYNLGQEVSS